MRTSPKHSTVGYSIQCFKIILLILFISPPRLFEVIETLGGRIHLVTEWIQGGELYNRISQEGPIKESNATVLYKQLLLAVQHMV